MMLDEDQLWLMMFYEDKLWQIIIYIETHDLLQFIMIDNEIFW